MSSSSTSVALPRSSAVRAAVSAARALVTVADDGCVLWRCATCGVDTAELDDRCIACNVSKSEAVRRDLAAARAALGVGVESNASFTAIEIEAARAAVGRAVDVEASEGGEATASTSDDEPSEAEQERRCVRCQKIYESVSKLKKHERDHHGPEQRCPECQYSSSNKGNLKKHIDSVHSNIPRVVAKKRCPHCSNLFTTGGDFDAHVRTHTGEKPYECPYCLPAAYKQAGALIQHIDSYHMKRRFFCLFAGCNKSYTGVTSMNPHLRSDHNINNNYASHYELRDTNDSPSTAPPIVRQVSHGVRALFRNADADDDEKSANSNEEHIEAESSSSSSSSSESSRSKRRRLVSQNDDDSSSEDDFWNVRLLDVKPRIRR